MLFILDTIHFVLCTLAILVAIGGLGFIVWEDIIAKKIRGKRLNVYSKVIIFAQIFFYCCGCVCDFILEYGNINTIGAEKCRSENIGVILSVGHNKNGRI